MDLGLVFDEEVEFCLGHRIAFEIHLESMSRFQWPFGLWVDWTLDMGIFRFVDSFHHVKIALSILFFPALVSIWVPSHCIEFQLAYSRVLGHKRAALRIYSGPKTNLFQRLTALR